MQIPGSLPGQQTGPEKQHRKGPHERTYRLYFLRKLRFFNICTNMLHIYYKSMAESTICFAAICLGWQNQGQRLKETKINY